MTKRIVLCADDYGQAPTISQGILALIQKGRLSATTCLVNSPYWSEHAAWLAPFQARIDIGLHFNLTEGRPVSKPFMAAYGKNFPTLSTLLRKAFLRQLDQAVIVAECRAQLEYFVEEMGFLPRFLDGHQHIHQFPVVRMAVLQVYEERLRSEKAYVRWVNEPFNGWGVASNFKRLIIAATGARAMKQLLLKNKVFHNQSFAGIYPFGQPTAYRQVFQRFLKTIQDGGLIMCHPGLASPDQQDAIAKARQKEFSYFNSEGFIADCQAADASIGRFARGAFIV